MSRLTGTVLERWCWCWCSHEVRVFSPVLAIQYPHVTSQVLCRRQQNISIHVYTFIFIYPYPRSSTGGFTPYNCMLSSFLIEEIEHWSSLLVQIELRKVSAQVDSNQSLCNSMIVRLVHLIDCHQVSGGTGSSLRRRPGSNTSSRGSSSISCSSFP